MMKFLFLIFIGGWTLAPFTARADDQPLPGTGFEASRYEALWTKSPFQVAAAEASQGSSDYALKGIVQIDGTSYVSLIDNNNQGAHFLLSSDKPNRGLTLISVALGHDGTDTQAVVQKDGKWITIKIDKTAVAAAAAPPAPINQPPMPGAQFQQVSMPGANVPPSNPGYPGIGMPPHRFRHPPISVPSMPQQQQPPQP